MKYHRRICHGSGSVLILVLSVLALLSVVAVTMATTQTLARKESARYMERLGSLILARTGFERALAELKRDPFNNEYMYHGGDLNLNGVLDEGEGSAGIDLSKAMVPSYYIPNDSDGGKQPSPRLLTIDGSEVGISGYGSVGTFAPGGNVYSLRVNDLQGRIHLNDGSGQYGGNNSSVSQNLKRILNLLVRHPDLLGADAPERFGQELISRRPPAGFRNPYEVLRVLQDIYGSGRGRDIYDKIKDHVTVYAWVDDSVCNPVPLSHAVYDGYPIAYYRRADPSDAGVAPVVGVRLKNKEYLDSESTPDGYGDGLVTFRRGRGKNARNEYIFSKEPLRWFDPAIGDDNHNAIYGLDELFPQYVEVVSRAPVNLNSASIPVLTSLVADVAGFFISERRRYTPYSPSPKDFSVTTIAKFQDTEFTHSATIPQRYESWEYAAHSYDNDGYTMFNGTQVKDDADEFGFLYRTVPIMTQWEIERAKNEGENSSAYALDAGIIAGHMKAAINGYRFEKVDYANHPELNGGFRNWKQFYRFMDFLVERGIIRDRRNIFWNYLPNGWENIDSADLSEGGIVRYPPTLDDPAQQLNASYAAADALKANFNPNLHLNELNPDEALYLRVDKTDLIINSTELCFIPMGYFSIESIGRVLKASDKNGYTEVSGSRVFGVVKAFDVHREGTQEEFLRGQFAAKLGSDPTNSGYALEVGPAPLSEQISYLEGDDLEIRGSNFALGYEGYIQLATLGGIDGRGEVVDGTPSGSPHWPTQDIAQYEGLHVHFQFDKMAHYHASASQLGDEFRGELSGKRLSSSRIIGDIDPAILDPGYGRKVLSEDGQEVEDLYLKNRRLRYNLSGYGKIEKAENYHDDNRPLPEATKRKLARSFSLVADSEQPLLRTFSPSDLRIDGAYVERHSGLAYWVDEGISMSTEGGAVSMWLKPSFRPEMTGKMRKIISYDRRHASNPYYRNPDMFSMLFAPAHDTPPYRQSPSELEIPVYMGSPSSSAENRPLESGISSAGVRGIRPASFFAGIQMFQAGGSLEDWEYDLWSFREKVWKDSGTHLNDIAVYYNTPSLNHTLHPDGNDKYSRVLNQLEVNRWTHIIWSWGIKGTGSFDIIEAGPDLAKLNEAGDKGKLTDRLMIKKPDRNRKIIKKRNPLPAFQPPTNNGPVFTQGPSISYGNPGQTGGGGGGSPSPTPLPTPAPGPATTTNNNGNITGGSGIPTGSEENKQDGEQGVLSYRLSRVSSQEYYMKIIVNGLDAGMKVAPGGAFFSAGPRKPVFSLHSYDEKLSDSGFVDANVLRIGEVSEVTGERLSRNFSGDFTVDELYVFRVDDKGDELRRDILAGIESTMKGVFNKGRYYTPLSAQGKFTDAQFESAVIEISTGHGASGAEKPPKMCYFGATVMGGNNPDQFTITKKTVLKAGDVSDLGDNVFGRVIIGRNDETDSWTMKYRVSISHVDPVEGMRYMTYTPVIDDVTICYRTGIEVLFYTYVAL